MTTDRIQRKLWMSPELKEQVVRYWRMNPQYRSESQLFGEAIGQIAEVPIDENMLAASDQPGKASARVWVDPEVWQLATTRAAASGLSLHSVIRRRVKQIMKDGNGGTD